MRLHRRHLGDRAARSRARPPRRSRAPPRARGRRAASGGARARCRCRRRRRRRCAPRARAARRAPPRARARARRRRRPDRLDVDDDVRLRQRRLHGALDRVGRRMALADGGVVVDADHDVREDASRRLAHAQPPQLHRRLRRRRSPGAPPPPRPRARGPSARRRSAASAARRRSARARRRRAPRWRPRADSRRARAADRRARRASRRGRCRSGARSTRAPGSSTRAPRASTRSSATTSMQITMPITSSAYQVAFTARARRRRAASIARQTMKTLATTRIAPSASAARCSAFPWPYWWPGSAGRTATPTAKNVSSAAMRSVPESAAAEMRPRLCVARPVPSLSAMSATAANTDQSAAFRWGSTAEAYEHRALAPRSSAGRRRLGRRRFQPRSDAIGSGGQMSASCRNAKWQQRGSPQRERRDRGQLDLGLRRAEQPAVVVHLGSRVARRRGGSARSGTTRASPARRGCSRRSPGSARRRPGRARRAARTRPPASRPRVERHPRVEGGHVVDAPHAERGEPARGVDAEEPDAGQAVRAADVRADVELEEGRDPRQRQRAAGAQRAHAEEHDRRARRCRRAPRSRARRGRAARTSAVGTGQCAQNTCSHVWPSVQRLSGSGNGRCPTRRSERACRLAALASSKRSVPAPRGCRAAPARARSPRTGP